MYTRRLVRPENSILLLGPRGTGKSTWIRQLFENNNIYDMLSSSNSLRLSKEPGDLYRECALLPRESWVIIDEVQKVPALLDEVQRLMDEKGLRFVLSGSSARKLKRGSANLLAGRATLVQMFPLVSAEVGFGISLPKVLVHGTLPSAFLASDPVPYLRTYAEVYLQEEIKGEALTRSIGLFARFLEVAARQNGQLTNVTAIARDTSMTRATVQGYFDILIDTLIGSWLPAWKLKRSTKQVAHPKFYFFDPGVARALSGRLPYPPTQEELGPLLETYLLGELRAYLANSGKHYPLSFWRSRDGVEADVFLETANGYVGIEIKASSNWDNRFNRGLQRVREDIGKDRTTCLGVYTGEREALFDGVRVMPVLEFLKALWGGELLR